MEIVFSSMVFDFLPFIVRAAKDCRWSYVVRTDMSRDHLASPRESAQVGKSIELMNSSTPITPSPKLADGLANKLNQQSFDLND